MPMWFPEEKNKMTEPKPAGVLLNQEDIDKTVAHMKEGKPPTVPILHYFALLRQLTQSQTELAEAIIQRDKFHSVLECSNKTVKRRTDEYESELIDLRGAVVALAHRLKKVHDEGLKDDGLTCIGKDCKTQKILSSPIVQRTLVAAEGKEK